MKTNVESHRRPLTITVAKGAALGALTVCLWRVSSKALAHARATRSLTRGLSKSLDEYWQWMPG